MKRRGEGLDSRQGKEVLIYESRQKRLSQETRKSERRRIKKQDE
jgi:hypothetical protein